jgi:hypothetical protein
MAATHRERDAAPWFTTRMTRTLADILRDARSDADLRGIKDRRTVSTKDSETVATTNQEEVDRASCPSRAVAPPQDGRGARTHGSDRIHSASVRNFRTLATSDSVSPVSGSVRMRSVNAEDAFAHLSASP